MSTTKLYKLDNGNSYATNCFPARNILRTSEEGAGHWLVAHRAAQKTKFEAMICAKSLQEKVGGTPQYKEVLQHHGYTDEMIQENILDRPFLINLHCVKIPSDLCSVDISNKNLVSAKEDDFEQFDSVAYINATENLLTLEVVFTSASREPPLLDVFMEGNDRSCLADAGTPPASVRNTLSQKFTPPFPELRYLSLANNKIKNEEDLLAVALFPSLAELTFHSNPLTILRSGDPPLLTSFLQHRLGIKLMRRKISKLEKPHIFIPVKANRKVTSHVPKVPKQPLMLEAPLESSFWKLWLDTEGGKLEESEEGSHGLSLSDPLPPIRPSSAQQHQEPYDDTKMLGSHREVLEKEKYDSKLGPASAEDDIEFFFLTQLDDADDIPSSVWRHELEERQGKRKHKSRTSGSCTYIPTKYKGYEELLRVKTDPEFIEPVGMQQNVQALRRALKQPLVYRDSKARLDSVQKPYVPRRKKMGKPPGPPSRKTKAEVLEDILLAMRGNMNIREVPLVSVLRKKKSNRKAYQEALGLMKEFHQKYKAALATSSKAICKESVTIPELGQSPTQETFVEIEESKSETLPQDTDESESLNPHLSREKSSSQKRSGVTFAL
ncbi:X-ray radiation resistance-associated protein 1 isoform X2 [Gopherus flavomarginatus]|uniref:X-ray radiation resistance-associated protein 1 isoform X2 n=1 Tax=Gopherus flavomarginatus TaxID=286002 RepID=UPI0021CBBB01|nr:X-ray radiation resistance-associated protein 1 isoform X2 [Gopherus flavomarginatus]